MRLGPWSLSRKTHQISILCKCETRDNCHVLVCFLLWLQVSHRTEYCFLLFFYCFLPGVFCLRIGHSSHLIECSIWNISHYLCIVRSFSTIRRTQTSNMKGQFRKLKQQFQLWVIINNISIEITILSHFFAFACYSVNQYDVWSIYDVWLIAQHTVRRITQSQWIRAEKMDRLGCSIQDLDYPNLD